MRWLLIALACCSLPSALAPCEAWAADFMFAATVDGRRIEGRPLDWTAGLMTLMGRDGQLYEFDPRTATEARKTSPTFHAMSKQELMAELRRDFDERYDFTTTRHYVVVHPRGERSAWADRFEQIYSAFRGYIRVRGFRVQDPQFPLVAVVFRNKQQYDDHARKSGMKILPNSLGCYSHSSNRILLFDVTGGDPRRDWTTNAATIIHEATHQAAFNLGVHSRTSPPPYWIPEGVATLFEARGVWRPSGADDRKSRINAGYLSDFRRRVQDGKPPFTLAQFVASDTPFRRDATAAYAQAWALSFYLSETQPRQFCRHLEATADRPVYSSFSANERLRYFRDAFGDDLKVLEANFVQWVTQL